MASKPRNYEGQVPVVLSFRWAFRLKVFAYEGALVKLFLKLLCHWSWRCEVAILGFDVRPNHAHIIAMQRFDHHHPRRGIAAMMRNVLSALARAANIVLTHQGRIIERTYRSHNLYTLGHFIRQMAYVNGQDAHHGGPGLASSRPTTVSVEVADGLVYQIPVIPELSRPGASPAERAEALGALLDQIIERATALEAAAAQDADPEQPNLDPQTRAEAGHPWQRAMEAVGEVWGLELEADIRRLAFNSFAVDRDGEAWFAAREEFRRWHFPQFEAAPRRAPEVGDIIEVRITRIVRTHNPDGTITAEILDPDP